MDTKIKIGLILDTYILPSWKYDIIERITSSDFTTISLIIKNINGTDETDCKPGYKGSLIYRIYLKLDYFIFRDKNDYCNLKSIKPLLNNIPELYPKIIPNGNADEFSSESVDEIAKYDLDVILKLGFKLLTGQLLQTPKLGVWSFTMDNYGTEKYGMAGYYEVVRGNPVTNAELVILKDGINSNSAISRSWISTCSYSVHLNRDRLFRQASLIISGILDGISRYGADHIKKLEQSFNKELIGERLEVRLPSLFASMGDLASFMMILFRKIIKKIIYTDPFSWELFLGNADAQDFPGIKFTDCIKIKPPKSKFWADPFIVEKDDKYFVFVEEFIYRKKRAHISVLELNENGKLSGVRRIIEKPYHMSYPFIFEMGNDYYMLPETSANRTIELYRCLNFPDKWELCGIIMNNVNAVDSTLFFYCGKWWLFTNIDKTGGSFESSPDLYLFYTDNGNFDTWVSHPCNPIISDIRKARPAGKLFIHEGKIYRPSQDCAGRYGKAFWLNEILVLNETNYEEKQVARIEPYWDKKLKGTHTFNFDGKFKITDAFKYRKRIFFW